MEDPVLRDAATREEARRVRAQGEALGWFILWSGLIGSLLYVHPLLCCAGFVVLFVVMYQHVNAPRQPGRRSRRSQPADPR